MAKTAAVTKVRRAQQINKGEVETKTLAECLKVDFALLYRSIAPAADVTIEKSIHALRSAAS